MMVLGLDVGPTLTGWTCGDGHSVPACGVYSFAKVGTTTASSVTR